MPWQTPALKDVRTQVRDLIRGQLPGADANVPNSVLRVLSDNQGALCHLTLQYLDWLALQLMPDTAETEWLDRFAYIWLVNADGSTGRKMATPAKGTATFFGQPSGTIIPQSTILAYANILQFETTAQITAADNGAPAPITALDPGSLGNLLPGTQLALVSSVAGVTNTATVVSLQGGTDQETDDELRARVLERIRNPPMGGDAEDYVNWALRVPGVTRAWSYPLEMGIGTVTVRFMMDDLRADNGGFPLPIDIDAVDAYLETVRPVAVKDFFVVAPIPFPVDLHFAYLDSDDAATRAAITSSLLVTFFERAAPGLKWYRSWTDEGVAAAAGVEAYDLNAADVAMPDGGHMAVLGDITYG
jgi:uncharacterized phage protein gp47/JayE